MYEISHIISLLYFILERMRNKNPTFYKTVCLARTERLMIKAIQDFLNWEIKNNGRQETLEHKTDKEDRRNV